MNPIFKKIIPGSIKKGIYNYYKEQQRNIFIKSDNQIPKFELEQKHIKNLKPLLNREELLKKLPKNGVIAELGVDKGDFSELILNLSSPQKLHLIDCWGDQRYHHGLQKLVEQKFENQIADGIVEVNIGLSTDVVHTFQDNYFDWIYIDTDHSYPGTKAELALYSRKVKGNGIIAGHDYILGNWKGMYRYGVIEAVYEFCIKNDWEIIYITMENKSHPSFAIRKI